MSMIYRVALIVRRKAPYVAWANSFEDDVKLDAELAARPSIYLVPVPEDDLSPEEVLAGCWEGIFEEELSGWMRFEKDWPAERGREVFDQWFEVELGENVVDLAPEEPLTEGDLDAEDLEHALHTCAWCGQETEEGTGRLTSFPLPDRERFEHREGRVLSLVVPGNRVVTGIVTSAGSEAAGRGEDLVFRVCSRACDQPVRKHVPKAVKKLVEAR